LKQIKGRLKDRVEMFALPYFNISRVKKITNHRMTDAAAG
jgi:hypothetical protein